MKEQARLAKEYIEKNSKIDIVFAGLYFLLFLLACLFSQGFFIAGFSAGFGASLLIRYFTARADLHQLKKLTEEE